MNIKLYKTIEDWWDDLEYDIKNELMENEYPDKSNFMDVDEMWNSLDWEQKYEIYSKSDDDIEELTEEEKQGIIGDRKAHEKMETEGRIE